MNFQPLCYQPNEAFEGRNKAYGAYMMRKIYQKRVITSVFLAIFSFTIAMGGPMLYYRFADNLARTENRDVHEIAKVPPPVEDKKVIPPPPVTPPPAEKPQVAQARFLEPVPSDTEKPEEIIEQKDLKDKVIGSENKEGKPDEGDVAPPAPVETQPAVIDAPKEDGNKIYTVVQKNATFKGGQEAMLKFMRRNFKYPRQAQKMHITGKVYVRFVVRKNGAIEDVTILKGMANCNDCNEEALRVVRMMPAWTPAEQNGNAVNVYFSLPIVFQLED